MSEPMLPTKDNESVSSNTESTSCEYGDELPESGSDSLNSLINEKSVSCADNCILDCSIAQECTSSCEDQKSRRRSFCCNTIAQCAWGVILLLGSIICFIFTPLDLMLLEKMNMRPGLPPYEWWADPPDEVKLRVYVFNVTNHERFLQGLDDKINLQEIGPIVYLEKLLHSNIRFNDNSTMTYTAKRYPIFLPQENTIDLNETVFVPNLAVLGLASYLYNAPYFVRAGFSLMVNSHGSEFFTKKTIHEYLWDFKDPVLDTSKSMVPGLVPVNNMGMLARIYSDFTDEVTVLVGPKWGHEKFFQIDRFRGEPQLPKYDPEECPDRIFGSTEGVMYRQHLTKQDVLLYWRKTVCKLMPLYFDDEVIIDDVPAFRYNLSESVFERVTNSTDCYDTVPSLPPGVSDGSKCYFDFPMVISYPHFYTGEPPKDHYVTGLEPDKYKHNSYAIVEPNTGTPFRSVARMQSNLRVHDLSGFFGQYKTFSNSIIPLFWAEYNQEGLPSNIRSIIHFMVVILPPLTIAVQVSMVLLGGYLILKRTHLCNKLFDESLNTSLPFKRKKVKCLADNKVFVYEKESFIKEPKDGAS